MQSVTSYRLRGRLSRVLLQVGLLALAVIVGFPLYWTLVVSVTPESQVFVWPLRLWAETPTLENYLNVFTRQDLQLPRWFFNSVLVSTAVTGVKPVH